MTERPILFNDAMVRAILSGNKTQTRQIIKNIKTLPNGMITPMAGYSPRSPDSHGIYCPLGQPGDGLWVRETCRAKELTDKEAESNEYQLDVGAPQYGLDGILYLADNYFKPINNSQEDSDRWGKLNFYRGARGAVVPSIHMPRWASRITLEITSVRVERLQEISEEDAWAEGVQDWMGKETPWKGALAPVSVHAYASLWESINGQGSWGSNPWVWAIEFKRVDSAV